MEINRTWIQQPIRLCMEEVWPYITDDTVLPFAKWEPRIDDDSRWYVASMDEEVAGVFWMRRVNAATWETHANVRPKFWGDKRGTALCRAAISEMISDTGAEKVVARIPTTSQPVMEMAEAIGFAREGVSVRSWKKNGELYDEIYYGITRT